MQFVDSSGSSENVLKYLPISVFSLGHMSDSLKFVLEVVVASAIIAIAIKTIGPYLGVPATNAAAIVFVLSPTLIMASLLGWRFASQQPNRNQDKPD